MKMNRKEFNKYYRDYVVGVDINDIEFKKFTYKELLDFLKINYYDDEFNKFVCWEPDGFMTPFGMYFLDFVPYSEDLSYLLGLASNYKGFKTIVFCMIYDKNYGPMDEDDKRVGYIDKIETNYFFRNKGVLKKALNYIRDEFKDNDVLVLSPESLDGSAISISDRIASLFGEKPMVMDEEEYVDSLVRRQKW